MYLSLNRQKVVAMLSLLSFFRFSFLTLAHGPLHLDRLLLPIRRYTYERRNPLDKMEFKKIEGEYRQRKLEKEKREVREKVKDTRIFSSISPKILPLVTRVEFRVNSYTG